MLLLNKYLRTQILILVSVFVFKNTYAQNLIRNGSFENYNTPVNWNSWGGDFIGYYVSPPDTVMIDWKQCNSPDYFLSACTHTYAGVPVNRFGYSYALQGNGYIGFGNYPSTNSYSEYFFQRLTSPLISGKTYCLSFYVSRADRIEYAIKNIGAYFSTSTPTMVSNTYINSTPQILNSNGFITDTTQWSLIQGCFTALGGEQYITIGNFNAGGNIDTLYVGTNNLMYGSSNALSYYFLDDITLIDQSTVGVNELKINTIFVYPNPVRDFLNIDVGTIHKNAKVEIYNTIGELVLTESLTTQNSSLKTHHLLSGIYFYHILVGERTIKTDKIVIIK